MAGYYNPYSYQPNYFNPNYQPQMQMPQQSAQPNPVPIQNASSNVNWVQGEAGARSWNVAPNNTVLLMDSESERFYLKSTDASGMPLPLRVFEYKERTNEQKKSPIQSGVEYVTKAEFDAFKDELLYGKPEKRQGGEKNEQSAV